MQISKRLGLSALLIAGIAISPVAPIRAMEQEQENKEKKEEVPTLMSYRTGVPLLGLFAAIIYLYNKEPNASFKPRYQLSKLIKPENVKDFFANLWYMFDDGVIGQVGKSNTLKANSDGSLEISTKKVSPAGIFGNADAKLKPLEKAFKSLAQVYGAYFLFIHPDIIQNFAYKLGKETEKAGHDNPHPKPKTQSEEQDKSKSQDNGHNNDKKANPQPYKS